MYMYNMYKAQAFLYIVPNEYYVTLPVQCTSQYLITECGKYMTIFCNRIH